MKKIAVVSMFLLVLGFAVGAQASTTTYTSYVAWLNAISVTPVNENFEDTTFEPGFSITEIGGAGTIHDGVYENIVDKDVPRYQVMNYAPGMSAFGGFFDLVNPGGAGTSIDLYINDTSTFVMNIPNTANGGFYGFVSDTSFTGARLQDGGGSGVQETYYGIDVSLAPTPAPEPVSMLLLVPGLLGLIGLRKRVIG